MELSIIIPVFREHRHIRSCLAHLAGLCLPLPHEILVVDGEPGASTLALLNSGPGITAGPSSCTAVRLITGTPGRGVQMNTGARAAKGKLFFFVHADSRPDPVGLEKMARAWQASGSNLFCGAFDLAIDSGRPFYRIIENIASLRSRLTRIPYGDQGIFISRALFEKIGGFPNQPLMEDVGLMAAVKKTGIKPLFLTPKIQTSARRWETRGIVFTTLSNWAFISLYLMGVSPEKLARWYYWKKSGRP